MKSLYYKTNLTFLGLIFGFFLLPISVLAATPTITTSSNPLFTNTNLLVPGKTITATITLENNTGENQTIYFASENYSSTGLAEALNFTINDGSTTYYSGFFADYFTSGAITANTLLWLLTSSLVMKAVE